MNTASDKLSARDGESLRSQLADPFLSARARKRATDLINWSRSRKEMRPVRGRHTTAGAATANSTWPQ